MADIRAFAAIRPRKGLEARIAALPYDVYNTEEAREIVNREPLSFLRIDRAETSFPREEEAAVMKTEFIRQHGICFGKGSREGISCRRIRHVITCMV